MPAIQKAVKQKAVVSAGVKSTRGRPASARGGGKSYRWTLKEIKEEITRKKDEPEPLLSEPLTIDDDDDDKKDTEKENPPIVPEKHQTAQRGRRFHRSIGRGDIRKIQVTECSVNLDKNSVAKSTGANEKKKTEMKANKNTVTEEKAKENSKIEKKEEAKTERKDTDSNEQKEEKLETSAATKVETAGVEEKKEDNIANDIVETTEEQNNSVCKDGSFELSTMIGYVNNSEIATVKEEDLEVEIVTEETKIANNDTHMMLESEEDKEHRIAVIGQSLTISKLEDELAKELEDTFSVQNTEERIRRLRMVLGLLQKSDFTKKETDIENYKLESGRSEKREKFEKKKKT